MANSVDPDQTAPIGAVCSGSTLFASILTSSVMSGSYLQQITSAGRHFQQHFYLAPYGLICYTSSAHTVYMYSYILTGVGIFFSPTPADQSNSFNAYTYRLNHSVACF